MKNGRSHKIKLSARALLFKNNIIDAWHAKTQLVGLIVLVFLTATIFTIASITNTRIDGSYQNLISESNLHDFVVDFSETTIQTTNTLESASEEQIEQSALDEAAKENNFFTYDRIESREFSLQKNTKIVKVMDYSEQQGIDKLIVFKGQSLSANDQHGVIVNEEFANNNNLKIGDVIRLQTDELGDSLLVSRDVDLSQFKGRDIDDWIDKSKYSTKEWFQIRGFGVSADMMAPIIDQTTPLPDKHRTGVVYINALNFGLFKENKTGHWIYDKAQEKLTVSSDADREVYYVGKFNSTSDLRLDTKIIDSYLRNSGKWQFHKKDDANAQVAFDKNDLHYRFSSRVNLIAQTINAYHLFAWLLIAVVLVISIFVLILVIKKRIEHTRTQLGVLKALGYFKRTLITSFFAYPLLIAFIGGTIGWLLGLGVQEPIIKIFTGYFNIVYGDFYFDWLSWTFSFLLIFILLAIFTMLLTFLILRQDTMRLIHNQSQIKMAKYMIFVKHLFQHTRFTTRLRASLFVSSTGKMGVVTFTMLLGTIMLTAAICGPKIMQDNLTANYTGLNYKTMVEYEAPVWNLPYTFYRVYDPQQKSWAPEQNHKFFTPDLGKVMENIYSGQINPSFYNPDINFLQRNNYMPMSFMPWKNMGSSFLNNQSRYGQPSKFSAMDEIIAEMSWPKYQAIKTDANLKRALDCSSGDVALNDFSFTQQQNMYQIMRKFYAEFRNSIGMSINKDYFKDSAKNDDNYAPSISKEKINFNDINLLRSDHSTPAIPFDIYEHHLPEKDDAFIMQTSMITPDNSDILVKMINWFIITYDKRIADAIVQGTYSRAPYFVKQNMAQAFIKKTDFNIAFNLEPYRMNYDYLGTYLSASAQDLAFKIYGLDQSQKMVNLIDKEGNSLNGLLTTQDKKTTPPIIVNESLAKKLNLQVGDTVNWDVIRQTMSGNIDGKQWNDQDKWSFDLKQMSSPYYGPFGMNAILASHGGQKIYNTFMPTSPSSMESAVATQKALLNTIHDSEGFTVVGIHDGYGDPKAYIAQQTANKIMQYDDSQRDLYKYFLQEWTNMDLNDLQNDDFNFGELWEYPDAWSMLNALHNGKYQSYDELVFAATQQKDKLAVYIKKMFNNEFPIFNYKLSKNDVIDDLTAGFSTSQRYGDMSLIGLDGLVNNGQVTWPAYSLGSTSAVLPINVSRAILQEITQLVDAILLTFAVISLIIAFTIIMLSTNLIVRENRTIISCMKALGYNNMQINRIILEMYIPMIVVSYIIGVVLAWVIIRAVINNLTYHTIWVLPFAFSWWIPLISLVIIVLIYLVTLFISWIDLRKVGLIYALKVTE